MLPSPRQDERIPFGHLEAVGEAEPGAKVSVDGMPLRLDDKGRFAQVLRAAPGKHRLTFRSRNSEGVERVLLRSVVVLPRNKA